MTPKMPMPGVHRAAVAVGYILMRAANARAEGQTLEPVGTAPIGSAVPDRDPGRDHPRRPMMEPNREIESRRGGTSYLVVNVFDGRDVGDRSERGLVKFRIDLQYDVVRAQAPFGYLYVSFPLRLLTFWDLFDVLPGSESAPFNENDYAPALELSWVSPDTVRSFISLRLGARHESNGQGLLESDIDQRRNSRSWNFAYLGASYAPPLSGLLRLELDAQAWLPFYSSIEHEWPNGRDADTRLEDHIGRFEVGANLQLVLSEQLYPTLRVRARRASLEAELRLPLQRLQLTDPTGANAIGFRIDLLAMCHFGKGERLIIANEDRYSCYAGIGL
jgi:hypothetical protein